MGIISKRKNKKYAYTPRFYESDTDGSPYKMEQKFDKFRSTVGDNVGLKKKLVNAWEELRTKQDKTVKLRIFVIVALLVLIFLFIIEFDLSIFYTTN